MSLPSFRIAVLLFCLSRCPRISRALFRLQRMHSCCPQIFIQVWNPYRFSHSGCPPPSLPSCSTAAQSSDHCRYAVSPPVAAQAQSTQPWQVISLFRSVGNGRTLYIGSTSSTLRVTRIHASRAVGKCYRYLFSHTAVKSVLGSVIQPPSSARTGDPFESTPVTTSSLGNLG